MSKLKENVISYLNMGLNPTVISFEDDGLYYLFDKLLQGQTSSNSYDPIFTFVHLTSNSISEISPESIENEINNGLKRDKFEGDDILETYANEVETVCVIDDIALADNVPQVISAADSLIKKYRGILHFVYVVENPMLINDLKGQISPTSSFLDALMFQTVGDYWSINDLRKMCELQFKSKVKDEEIEKISRDSGNHLGLFKRLYKDKVTGLNTSKRYLDLLIDSLDDDLLNTFKKVVKGYALDYHQIQIYDSYAKVGFIKNDRIKIPLIENIIDGIVITNETLLRESNEVSNINFDDFNKIEKKVLKTLMSTQEILTKSQIGDIVWGDEVNEKYSDWAIDQRIARLRKKMIDLGVNLDIQTVYGQGYKIAFIK